MSLLLVLAILLAAAVLALARAIAADGYGMRPPPRSRLDDVDPRPSQGLRLTASR